MGGEADVGCACDTSKKEYRYLDMETKPDPTEVESPRKFKGFYVCIPTENMTKDQQDALWEAEKQLRKAGIGFDTGGGFGGRDWRFDWSLRGLYVKCVECNNDSRNCVKEYATRKLSGGDSEVEQRRAELGY